MPSLDPLVLAGIGLAAAIIVHVGSYLLDPHGIRSIPGPLLAKFTDAWLGWIAAQGHRSEVVHGIHAEYGRNVLPSFMFMCEIYTVVRSCCSDCT
jgi:benzoate 4-monooxygenase